jgi:hypothetical protein
LIPENGGGAGVRLIFSSSETARLSTWEAEGGATAEDEVPKNLVERLLWQL